MNTTDDNDNSDSSGFDALRRYVPLIVWAVVLLTVLAIPLKIISYGYLPGDDALRHAAKAVSGKPWSEILVLKQSYTIDHEFGWNLLLGKIHYWTDCNAEKLVLFSVVGLFVIVGWPVLASLKRPEAWLGTLVLMTLMSGLTARLLYGRPFALTVSALMVILLLWERQSHTSPKWRVVLWMTPLIALAVYLHGVWYLWALPVAAFFLSRQFRWGLLAGGQLGGGNIIGCGADGSSGAITRWRQCK
ncbi:MAG: hypothetical protein WDM76_07340 [Limisphaerales bacterium]